MCDSLDYDYSTSYSYNDDLTQSLYSAVIDNLTVCAGYSKMAEAVLNSCGVSTVGITAPGHMWNRVQLDDEKWYSLDITWNDAIGSYYGELFLNRSDSHIKTFNCTLKIKLLFMCKNSYILHFTIHILYLTKKKKNREKQKEVLQARVNRMKWFK